ncbi:MAG: sensor domain-containing diguanylate cyclase, partial [Nitrospirota bacterium]
NSFAGIIFIWLLGMTGIVVAGRRLVKSDRECKAAEGRLVKQHNELHIMNNELQIINSEMEALNSISTAINQTLDLGNLLNNILETITGLEMFNVERKGGIFIIEGDRLNLVAHIGHSKDFLEDHRHIKIGECLCGKAAKTGQVITSMNSENDHDHSNRYHGMTPHGHIIIPLKTLNGTVGILCLYTPADIDIKKHKIYLLQSIGNQIGTAIENARLYEETKALSLRDPLTGLANRRMMSIVFGRNLARARRLGKPLSIIMMDVDYFKQYNDTYGHAKGDEILVRVANILLKETREIDLVARYGGEEFFIMIPEADLPTACEAAERIRNAVESMTGVTVSFGVSSYSAGMGEEELIRKADSALYQAKNKGRNRVEAGL